MLFTSAKIMSSAKAEKHTSTLLKIIFRVVMNTGLVVLFQTSFSTFFILEGGVKALVLVGLTLAFLNWLIVPILHVLSLPIKFFAWIIGFLIVNMAALWLTVWFVASVAIEGMSLTIGGGIVGWLVISFILGFGNWIVRAILK